MIDFDDYTGDIKTTTNTFCFFDLIQARLLLDTISTSKESEESTKTLKKIIIEMCSIHDQNKLLLQIIPLWNHLEYLKQSVYIQSVINNTNYAKNNNLFILEKIMSLLKTLDPLVKGKVAIPENDYLVQNTLF